MEREIIKEIKEEVNYQLNNFSSVEEIKKLILECNGNIYILGVGKSNTIGKLFSDLLKSISIKSFNLDVTNLLHGDSGAISDKDILIILSKSGKTEEIKKSIGYIEKKKPYVIGIFCDECNFRENISLIINLPFKSEISGDINSIPSNSIMSYILFINILIADLKNHITQDKYKKNHPFGSIGKNMKRIPEVMINAKDCCILDKNKSLKDGIIMMNLKKLGIILITEKEEIYGIITDRDIRNYLEFNETITIKLEILINKNFFYIEDLDMRLEDIEKEYNFIPVVKNNKFLGLVKM